MSKSQRKRHLLLRLIIAIVIALLLAGSLFFTDRIESALGWKEDSAIPLPNAKELRVHFIDVGQADSCVIELPDDRKMIIDGGDVDAAAGLIDYIDSNIFEGQGGGFDFAILTHSDADHCGSLDDVISRYPVEVFYRPNVLASYSGFDDPGKEQLNGEYSSKNTKVYKEVIDAAYKNSDSVVVTDADDDTCNVIRPEGLQQGDAGYYEINFFTPTKDSYKDWNDYSPIMILEYAGKRIVFSGDAEKENEAEFVDLAKKGQGKFSRFDENFTVDVIKLGHHGSDTSSSREYLDTLTTPDSCASLVAVISCGAGNSYGHPKPEVLARLADMGVKEDNILRTDIVGSVLISVKIENGIASVVVNDKTITTVRSRHSWKKTVIILITVDFAVIIILPELAAVPLSAKKKRRK